MANEFTRITHATSGGFQIFDVNPNKVTTGNAPGYICLARATATKKTCIQISGYKKFAIMPNSGSDNITLSWYNSDGTETIIGNVSGSSWSQYYDIPDNAVGIILETILGTASWYNTYYSLLTT